MNNKSIPFFCLSAAFAALTAIFLGITLFLAGVALYGVFGPHDLDSAISGIVCFIMVFPSGLCTVLFAGGVFPFTSLFQKMNDKKSNGYITFFFIFAVVAILLAAACIIAPPVLAVIF